MFIWDFKDPEAYTTIFGLKVLAKWPPLINRPHFEATALYTYFGIPLIIVGALWYLVIAQAYLARTIRAIKLSKTVFEKNLDNFNQNPPVQPSGDNVVDTRQQ